MTNRPKRIAILFPILMLATGCHQGPRELNSQAFLTGAPTGDASVTRALNPTPTPEATVVTATTQPIAMTPTTAPSAATTSPSTIKPGQYETLGGVIAEVNGTPIYANKVIALLDKVLAAKAKEVEPNRFRSVALDLLTRQRFALIQDELEYAAAERFLNKEDKELALQLTIRWRAQQIVESGGSPEVTKRHAADIARKNDFPDDLDFDGVVQYQHRRYMRDLFLERRIRPKLQVSASDMRRFYEASKDKIYSEHAAAQFRVIKIDPKKYDSREAAITRAKGLRDQIVSGEKDFATVAAADNDDPFLKDRAGDVTGGKWIDRGAYVITEVEDAVWKLQPGQVTDIIPAKDAYYLAKLEASKAGNTRPFSDPTVQDDVRSRISAQQYAALRDKVRQDLTADALIRADDDLLDAAMEMVMQKYARPAKGEAATR